MIKIFLQECHTYILVLTKPVSADRSPENQFRGYYQMKMRCIKIALTAASLLLAANLAFAAEPAGDAAKAKAADTKDAAKAKAADTKDAAKAKAADTKDAAKAKAADTKDAAKAKAADTKDAAKAKAADTKDAAKAKAADTKDAAKAKAADTKDAAKAKAADKLIDINTASEAELKAIPGIGDTYAAKIIAGRPYAKKDQLKSRNILPAPAYEKVKDQIIAKKAAKPAAAKKK
jgi:DNA uptake protein ComE-like DNA-binding protein